MCCISKCHLWLQLHLTEQACLPCGGTDNAGNATAENIASALQHWACCAVAFAVDWFEPAVPTKSDAGCSASVKGSKEAEAESVGMVLGMSVLSIADAVPACTGPGEPCSCSSSEEEYTSSGSSSVLSGTR